MTKEEKRKAQNKKWELENKEKTAIRHKEYYQENKERIQQNTKLWEEENKEKRKAQNKKWELENKEKRKEQNKKWELENKEKIKEQKKEWYQKNKEKIKEQKKEWRQKNKEKMKEQNKKKYKTDSLFKLKCTCRNRTYDAFKSKGYKKTSRTHELLGADYETVMNHIEKQFEDWMTWDNHGEWHIDHIVPLRLAESEEEMKVLCHYSNLQPLSAFDNISKGGSI